MTTDQITAFVTGANRGLGKQFAAQLVERGAKVYAAARRPETVDVPGVIPVQLDITDPESIARAAELAGAVNVLINNAGVSTGASLLTGSMDDVRLEMETHYVGTLSVTRAFVPVIEGNGGGSVTQPASRTAGTSPDATCRRRESPARLRTGRPTRASRPSRD